MNLQFLMQHYWKRDEDIFIVQPHYKRKLQKLNDLRAVKLQITPFSDNNKTNYRIETTMNILLVLFKTRNMNVQQYKALKHCEAFKHVETIYIADEKVSI